MPQVSGASEDLSVTVEVRAAVAVRHGRTTTPVRGEASSTELEVPISIGLPPQNSEAPTAVATTTTMQARRKNAARQLGGFKAAETKKANELKASRRQCRLIAAMMFFFVLFCAAMAFVYVHFQSSVAVKVVSVATQQAAASTEPNADEAATAKHFRARLQQQHAAEDALRNAMAGEDVNRLLRSIADAREHKSSESLLADAEVLLRRLQEEAEARRAAEVKKAEADAVLQEEMREAGLSYLRHRQRASEFLQAEEKKRRLEAIRDPNRPSVWDDNRRKNEDSDEERDKEREKEKNARAEPPDTDTQADDSPSKRSLPPPPEELAPRPPRNSAGHMPPPPQERAPPRPGDRLPPDQSPPRPSERPPQQHQRVPQHGQRRLPQESPHQSPQVRPSPAPNDEGMFQTMKPPPPSLTGDSVWGHGNETQAKSNDAMFGQVANASFPELGPEVAKQSKKERKMALQASQVADPAPSAPHHQSNRSHENWWGEHRRERHQPTGTISLQELAKAAKRSRGDKGKGGKALPRDDSPGAVTLQRPHEDEDIDRRENLEGGYQQNRFRQRRDRGYRHGDDDDDYRRSRYEEAHMRDGGHGDETRFNHDEWRRAQDQSRGEHTGRARRSDEDTRGFCNEPADEEERRAFATWENRHADPRFDDGGERPPLRRGFRGDPSGDHEEYRFEKRDDGSRGRDQRELHGHREHPQAYHDRERQYADRRYQRNNRGHRQHRASNSDSEDHRGSEEEEGNTKLKIDPQKPLKIIQRPVDEKKEEREKEEREKEAQAAAARKAEEAAAQQRAATEGKAERGKGRSKKGKDAADEAFDATSKKGKGRGKNAEVSEAWSEDQPASRGKGKGAEKGSEKGSGKAGKAESRADRKARGRGRNKAYEQESSEAAAEFSSAESSNEEEDEENEPVVPKGKGRKGKDGGRSAAAAAAAKAAARADRAAVEAAARLAGKDGKKKDKKGRRGRKSAEDSSSEEAEEKGSSGEESVSSPAAGGKAKGKGKKGKASVGASAEEDAKEDKTSKKGGAKAKAKARWVVKTPVPEESEAVAEDSKGTKEESAQQSEKASRSRRKRSKENTREQEYDGEEAAAKVEHDGSDDEVQKRRTEKKQHLVSQEELDRLHPVDDTGFAVGRGMVCVRGEEQEEADGDEAAEFTTIKTKKEQKVQRQEERRKIEEETRREIRREARRQRQLRYKQQAEEEESRAHPAGDGEEAEKQSAQPKEEGPKHTAISLSALRSKVQRDREMQVVEAGSSEADSCQEDEVTPHRTEDEEESTSHRETEGGSLNGAPKREWVPQLHPSAAAPPYSANSWTAAAFSTQPAGNSMLFDGFPFTVGSVTEQSPKPSKEISEIWERPAATHTSRNQPPPFPAPQPTRSMLGPHGPPPPYKPPALGRAATSAIKAAQASAQTPPSPARGTSRGRHNVHDGYDNWRQEDPRRDYDEDEEEYPATSSRRSRRKRHQRADEYEDWQWEQWEDEWKAPSKGSSKGKSRGGKSDPPPPPPPEPESRSSRRGKGGKGKKAVIDDYDYDEEEPPPTKGKGSKGKTKGKAGKESHYAEEERPPVRGKGKKAAEEAESSPSGKGKGKHKGQEQGNRKGGQQWRRRN